MADGVGAHLMRVLFISQLAVAISASLVFGYLGGWSYLLASAFGALLGIAITLLVRRSTDRVLSAASRNPTHGMVALYSGFALRYGAAAVGLLAGFKVLHLAAEPMIGAFILMIFVQALTAVLVRSEENKRDK